MKIGDEINIRYMERNIMFKTKVKILDICKFGIVVESENGVREFFNIADLITKDKIDTNTKRLDDHFSSIKKVGEVAGYNKINYVYKTV